MISNKSQYILSKIGIPLFKEAHAFSEDIETPIYLFQKDNILTLHLLSVDAYPEKERNLLEAIISAIHDNPREPSMSQINYRQGESMHLDQIFGNEEAIKATLIFFDAKEFTLGMNYIQSASLTDMLEDPLLKKELWAQLKPLTLS